MKLIEYLKESLINENSNAFNIGKDFTSEQVKEMPVVIKNKIPDEFIDEMYRIWKKELKGSELLIPFRFSTNSIKICRSYPVLMKNNPVLDKYVYEYTDGEKGGVILKKFIDGDEGDNTFSKIVRGIKQIFSIENKKGLKIMWGDGSIFGARAGAGLKYENVVIDELKQIFMTIAAADGDDILSGKYQKLSESDFSDLLKSIDPKLSRYYGIYTQLYDNGDLIDILIDILKTPENIDKYIQKTGTSRVKRNDKGQIWNDMFEITDSDMNEVLEDSGDIISDITLFNTKGNKCLFISVKMSSSQLSGVFYNGLRRNKYLQDCWNNNVKWVDVNKTDPNILKLTNLCEAIGVSSEDIYEVYRCIYNKQDFNPEIKIDKSHDTSTKGGIIFRKLLGGNYWYVNPTETFYIPANNSILRWKPEDAHISTRGEQGPGRRWTINGKINGISSSFIFRTADKGFFLPYRLFPHTNVKRLIETI